jgi:RNA polymerase-interacting CarD/CdnL/TRCF family regulator
MLKFQPGDKVEHPRFGTGVIREVWAEAQNPDEETEYVVKLRGERWPAYLGEASLTLISR